MSLPSSERGAVVTMAPRWWAGGLSLADRLPAPGETHADTGVSRRLERWRDSVGAEFDHRLSDVRLDEDALRRLLAEPGTHLADRVDVPGWVGRVVAAVSGPRPAGTDHEPSLEAFAQPLQPFLDQVDAVIRAAVHAIEAAGNTLDLNVVCGQLLDDLAERLVAVAARTFVLELNVARVAGRLTGDTGRDRFGDYLRKLASPAGLVALFGEYPVLARVLAQTCAHAEAAHVELLTRFVRDRDAIVATLLEHVDPGPLTSVELGRGDRHEQGRAVAVLTFADGRRIVYKPRSQDLQVHFTAFAGWLNTRVSALNLRSAAALARDGYGWVEYIAHRPCRSVSEIDRFYRRQGALLALLYALDATDIHYENLIAAGDQPVLVDVETLFHPTLDLAVTAGPDPAHVALRSSVTRTSLLPYLLIGEHGAVDLSGLGGDKGGLFPFDSVSWDASGTDEMRLVRRPAEVRGAVNRPRFADRDIDPADYQSALLTGFRATYDAIVTHREELLGLLATCHNDDIRVVARPTRAYATLLDESTHPDLLRDGLDRDGLFDVLWADSASNPTLRRLVRHETADLWAGDIPLFHGRPGSRDLWTATGVRLPDVLSETSLAAVTAKIIEMDEVGRLDQEWLITAAMAVRTGSAGHRGVDVMPGPVPSAVPDQTRLLAAAAGIADQLVGRSLQDDRRANWLGLERVDGQHWAVMPMGAGLGDGYPGVALFLAELGQLTDSSRYLDLARKTLTPVPMLVETFAAQPALAKLVGPGAFAGLGGLCYALARLTTLLGDREIREWLAVAVAVMDGLDEGAAGIATGQAGGLMTMLAVHSETGLESAARTAGVFARRLAETANSRPEPAGEPFPATGFAAGPAGIAHALRRFGAEATPHDRPVDPVAGEHGWCTGLAGLLLAETDLRRGPDPEIDKAVAMLTKRPPLRDASLCHGELGVAEALVALATRGHTDARAGVVRYAARALGALERHGPRCGTPGGVPSPGLLSGLAGIGHGLLRLGFSDQVPSVLLLESKFHHDEP